jgi:predicted dehydrogenase
MKKLRIGIVGTGFIAPFHYHGFRSWPDAEIVGMCTHSNRAKLQQMCAEWCIRPYDCFDQMAQDPGIDALVLGSINTEHFSQIMTAQTLLKPVLVEKPVVTTLKDLDLIRASMARTGVPVVPAHNFIYRGAVKAGREIMRSGALGQIVYGSFISNHTISADHASGWRAKLALGSGGALMDSGHHQVYQSIGFMGTPVALHAFKSQLLLTGMEGEDVAHVQVQYASGAVGTLVQSWTNNNGGPVDGIRIVGTNGSLQITDALYINGVKQNSDADYANSFVNQARGFLDVVLKGAAPESSLDDARDTLQLILLAYQSAETNSVLRFRYEH